MNNYDHTLHQTQGQNLDTRSHLTKPTAVQAPGNSFD